MALGVEQLVLAAPDPIGSEQSTRIALAVLSLVVVQCDVAAHKPQVAGGHLEQGAAQAWVRQDARHLRHREGVFFLGDLGRH